MSSLILYWYDRQRSCWCVSTSVNRANPVYFDTIEDVRRYIAGLRRA